MGDHDDRAAFRQHGEGLLDQRLVLRSANAVASSSTTMGASFKIATRQRHALLFAAGKIRPLRAEPRIDAPRQLVQDVLTLGGLQRRQHLLARSLRARGADVFQDGRLEQATVLEHEGHLRHQHMGSIC